MEALIVLFLVSQLMLIPILGGIWLGIRREREQQARLLRVATTRLVTTRGGFRR